MEHLLQNIGNWVAGMIQAMGYAGIVLCMAIESACVPLPSEVIMPFAGFLVSVGRLTLLGSALAGAVGCVLGSLAAYAVGAWGGRPFLERYGRYVLLTMKDVDLADRWFERHGNVAIFTSRLMPVVRTFISLPAGIARMPLAPFVVLTFAGSFPWCLGLAWMGMKLGSRWGRLRTYFHGADAVIVVGVLVLGVLFVWHRLRELKAESAHRAGGGPR